MCYPADGHKPYIEAVWEAFGGDVDFAQIIKEYGPGDESGSKQAHRRYSPGTVPYCTSCCGEHSIANQCAL